MNEVTKKKMGRPLKSNEKLELEFKFRVSKKDLENLDKKCEKQKKSRSELLREFMNS